MSHFDSTYEANRRSTATFSALVPAHSLSLHSHCTLQLSAWEGPVPSPSKLSLLLSFSSLIPSPSLSSITDQLHLAAASAFERSYMYERQCIYIPPLRSKQRKRQTQWNSRVGSRMTSAHNLRGGSHSPRKKTAGFVQPPQTEFRNPTSWYVERSEE